MKVFYTPLQNARNPKAFSPSAGKPALVVADWLKRGLVEPDDILDFEPASREDLVRAHDPDMVDSILALEMVNGFGNCDPEVAASLPYTSGSMLAAAVHALNNLENVCSPTSGFHHAGFDFTGGFCTFNGLMVTALALLECGAVDSVGIIDCDAHYGNGTQDIIDYKRPNVRHHTMGKHFHTSEDVGRGGSRFLRWLDKAIEDCADVDLVLYQAGADPHIHDPLGGMLTELAMVKRDHAVFAAFKGRPLVWNLAGGYQRDAQGGIEPVLKLHRNTLLAQRVYQT